MSGRELFLERLRHDPRNETRPSDGEVRRRRDGDLVGGTCLRPRRRDEQRGDKGRHAEYRLRMAESAWPSSRQLWNRRVGSVSSNRTMAASKSGGMAGLRLAGGSGGL